MEGFFTSFLGSACYNQFFVKQNFFDKQCLGLLVSKMLGYAILLGSLIVKIPQIQKIMNAKSAKGISLSSVLLELVMYLIGWSYSFRRGFAFNTYGESAFMSVQDLVIVTLIFLFNKGLSLQFFAIITLYAATTYAFLFNPMQLVPMEVIVTLQQFTIPILIASRIPQIIGNFSAKSTGQLAFVTCLLNFLGSAARVFTTIQETQDTTLLACFVIAVLLNGIIVTQIIMYGNKEDDTTKSQSNSSGAAAPTSPKKVRPKRD